MSGCCSQALHQDTRPQVQWHSDTKKRQSSGQKWLCPLLLGYIFYQIFFFRVCKWKKTLQYCRRQVSTTIHCIFFILNPHVRVKCTSLYLLLIIKEIKQRLISNIYPYVLYKTQDTSSYMISRSWRCFSNDIDNVTARRTLYFYGAGLSGLGCLGWAGLGWAGCLRKNGAIWQMKWRRCHYTSDTQQLYRNCANIPAMFANCPQSVKTHIFATDWL